MSDMLSAEALVYPEGETDDILMALWFIKYNYRKMRPVHALPTRVRGSGPGNPWSWLRRAKERENTGEAAYHRLMKEQKKVSVG